MIGHVPMEESTRAPRRHTAQRAAIIAALACITVASCDVFNIGSTSYIGVWSYAGYSNAIILIAGTCQLNSWAGNGSNTNMVWSSSDPAVATVSSTGLVTGKALGTATITVGVISTLDSGLSSPQRVAVDAAGNVYVANTSSNQVVMLVSGGTANGIAGSGSYYGNYGGDGGPATAASLSSPVGVFVDSSGDIYIADSGNNRVREVH